MSVRSWEVYRDANGDDEDIVERLWEYITTVECVEPAYAIEQAAREFSGHGGGEWMAVPEDQLFVRNVEFGAREPRLSS